MSPRNNKEEQQDLYWRLPAITKWHGDRQEQPHFSDSCKKSEKYQNQFEIIQTFGRRSGRPYHRKKDSTFTHQKQIQWTYISRSSRLKSVANSSQLSYRTTINGGNFFMTKKHDTRSIKTTSCDISSNKANKKQEWIKFWNDSQVIHLSWGKRIIGLSKIKKMWSFSLLNYSTGNGHQSYQLGILT